MNSAMTDDMMCAGLKEGGKDACQGDSGGPLVASDPTKYGAMSLIGVVSWGYGCAGVDALGIYAEVSHFTNWLNQQMPDLSTCPPYAGGATLPPATPTPSPTPSISTTSPTGNGTCCSGCICSPEYPAYYPLSVEMEYVMTAAAGETITITFTDFNLEDYGCLYDYIQIYEGEGTGGTLLLDKTCGNNNPGTITTTTNTATLIFVSDFIYNYPGFQAQLSAGVTVTTSSTNTSSSSSTPSPSPSPSPSSNTTGSGSCGNCVFPFISGSRQSDRCTTVDGNSSPWCATSVDSSGYMLSWEYCSDPSCPGLAATNSPPMTVHPENAAGKCCKLLTPRYSRCSTFISVRLWNSKQS